MGMGMPDGEWKCFLVVHSHSDDFSQHIQSLLNDDWEMQGNAFSAKNCFAQVMTKFEPAEYEEGDDDDGLPIQEDSSSATAIAERIHEKYFPDQKSIAASKPSSGPLLLYPCDVQKLLGVSRVKFYELNKLPDFPKAKNPLDKRPMYLRQEILSWVNGLERCEQIRNCS